MADPFFKQLRFENLNFGFGRSDLLFDNVTVNIPLDSVTWIYGASGLGKSSLLRILAGLLFPMGGNYLINGIAVNNLTFEGFLPYRLRIGFGFDQGGLLNNKTVWDNLMLPLSYHRVPEEEAQARVKNILEAFRIKPIAYERPSSLARGMQKMAILARTFVLEPELVLLDDPTGGLGRDQKDLLKAWIVSQKEKGILKHIFLASEDYKFLENFINQRIEIVAKTLFINGRPPEGLESPKESA